MIIKIAIAFGFDGLTNTEAVKHVLSTPVIRPNIEKTLTKKLAPLSEKLGKGISKC